ncbi:fibronectin type III domain protein [Comamonas sp. JUb58]|nr:fibronectin type III domain protein [Comamonas sp. JUb58]
MNKIFLNAPARLALLGLMAMSGAHAAPQLIYDGSSPPAPAVWSQWKAGSPTVTSAAGLTRFSTKTVMGDRTSDANLYKYATGTNSFIASIKLKALAINRHNQLDAGLMLSVGDDFSGSFGNATQRSAMLYIDPTAIGWADDTASAANDASGFHEYAIRYTNGLLDVFVDTSFEAIIAGTAQPLLSRAQPSSGSDRGAIVFGDQTNDANVDSDYEVEFVKFQNLRLPTEPGYVFTETGDGQLTAYWGTPAYAGESAISGYTATALTTDTPPKTAGSCSTSATPPELAANFCTIDGLANGTPYIVSVQATNAAGGGASALTDRAATPVASVAVPEASVLANGVVGQSYNAVITPTGGQAPYQFEIVDGSLPQGLAAQLSEDGLSIRIAGTPSRSETTHFTLSISDSTPGPVELASKAGPTLTTVVQTYSITVAAPDVVVVPAKATPVPSLGVWAVLLLNLLAGGLAALGLRGRKMPAQA